MDHKVVLAKIKSFIGKHNDIVSSAFIRLYTTNKVNEHWLDSELEGCLCFVFDFNEKVRYFMLYDVKSYELLFKCQLYFDFDKNYQILSEDFHCFEIESGFVGFKFYDKREANKFTLNVIKYDDMHTIQYFKQKLNSSEEVEGLSFSKKAHIVKTKIVSKLPFFYGGKKEYDASTQMYICYMKRFLLIKDFHFDYAKRKFNTEKVSEDSKNFFRRIGVRKADINNTFLALSFFKQILEALDSHRDTGRKRSKAAIRMTRDSSKEKIHQEKFAERYSVEQMIKNVTKDGSSLQSKFDKERVHVKSPTTKIESNRRVDEEIEKYSKGLSIAKLAAGSEGDGKISLFGSPKKKLLDGGLNLGQAKSPSKPNTSAQASTLFNSPIKRPSKGPEEIKLEGRNSLLLSPSKKSIVADESMESISLSRKASLNFHSISTSNASNNTNSTLGNEQETSQKQGKRIKNPVAVSMNTGQIKQLLLENANTSSIANEKHIPVVPSPSKIKNESDHPVKLNLTGKITIPSPPSKQQIIPLTSNSNNTSPIKKQHLTTSSFASPCRFNAVSIPAKSVTQPTKLAQVSTPSSYCELSREDQIKAVRLRKVEIPTQSKQKFGVQHVSVLDSLSDAIKQRRDMLTKNDINQNNDDDDNEEDDWD